ILDVQMPGMDGIEALGVIKKLKPLTEVLMLTGHGTIETAIEGMKIGAYDFLLKPCKIDVLLEKINGAYERKSEHEERIRKALVDKLSTSPMSVLEK
ncbi:MAG: response regulator, partial [Deltaproteobacteria bacterium]|nr:response regulator [Deltaproteobacteria bacterium]MBW2572196.1 response regulator [Deltaproteobacteria bacterium]